MLGNQASSQQCHGQENVTLLALFVSPPSFLKPRCTASFVYLDSLPPSPSPLLPSSIFVFFSYHSLLLYYISVCFNPFKINFELTKSRLHIMNHPACLYLFSTFSLCRLTFRTQRYEYRNMRHQSFNLYILLIVLVIIILRIV